MGLEKRSIEELLTILDNPSLSGAAAKVECCYAAQAIRALHTENSDLKDIEERFEQCQKLYLERIERCKQLFAEKSDMAATADRISNLLDERRAQYLAEKDKNESLLAEGTIMREALEKIPPRRDGAAFIAEEALTAVSSRECQNND